MTKWMKTEFAIKWKTKFSHTTDLKRNAGQVLMNRFQEISLEKKTYNIILV